MKGLEEIFLEGIAISSIEQICQKATLGPWSVSRQIKNGYGFIYLVMGNYSVHFDTTSVETLEKHGKDAEFCAMARTVLPEALLEIKSLKNKITNLECKLNSYEKR